VRIGVVELAAGDHVGDWVAIRTSEFGVPAFG